MKNSSPRPSRLRGAHPRSTLAGSSRSGGVALEARDGDSRLAGGGEASGAAWHQLHREEILRLLEVDLRPGLDAGEVLRRREKYGLNSITPRPGAPAWLRFLRQFNQPLVYLLLVAVVVTGWLGEWVDSSVIFGVILLNAIIGFVQESKAENAIESLSRMVTTTVTVRRNGRRHRIPSEQLVPGDVVLLEAGDRVGADLRLFEVRELNVDESALTGESVAVLKHTDVLALDTVLADRRNLAFAGTIVTSGYGEGVVWATGDRTETGRIAWLVAEAVDLSTPLTRKIERMSHWLLWGIMVLAVATFAIGLARGNPPVDMFMAAVALAVGAIPEGLPAAVTIVLAIGVARMARRRAIIRKLPAVETLGSTTMICTDKTGTLTRNEMTVREIFAGGETFEVTGTGYEPAGELQRLGNVIGIADYPALLECLRAGVLCNDAQLSQQEGRIDTQGDPTEVALVVAGEKGGVAHAEAHRQTPQLDSLPFESARMYRATLHDRRGGRVIYKVGAVERVLERCVDALGREGELVSLDQDAVHAAVATMASQGLRVLAFARRHVRADHGRLEHGHVAGGLTFLGLEGMLDPPRPEAILAVRRCQEAGIAVKMITGDHLITARTIGQQIGLRGRGEAGLVAISGRELEAITDAELPDVAERTDVFARVAPEQKLRLVRALQSKAHIVAMTGDGVNDAPALKQADIGIAMGKSGTEVAKNAADMLLTDDNFATIEAAVEEGRGVFDNLTKFIVWTLPTNAGEASILLTAIVLGTTLPALPVQLLWVNLVTAILLGLMLVFEPKERGIMQRPPRDPRKPLITFALAMRSALVISVMLAGAFWVFFWEMQHEGETLDSARTAVVNVIVMVEVAYLFNCRSLVHSARSLGLWSNRWAVGGSLAMIAAQLLFTYAPVMNTLFHTAPISLESWLRILGVAFAVFIVVEVEKWIRFHGGRGDHVVPE